MQLLKHQLSEYIEQNLKYPVQTGLQQRGIADLFEDACNKIIKEHFQNVVDATSRRSIEDISIGQAYVDHKTSDQALEFKMPNLISIDRLRKLDRPLIYNFIIYNSRSQSIIKTLVLDVYELNWKYLKIQNLGKGQLQISSMSDFLKDPIYPGDKAAWIAELKTQAVQFYEKVKRDAEKRQKLWLSL